MGFHVRHEVTESSKHLAKGGGDGAGERRGTAAERDDRYSASTRTCHNRPEAELARRGGRGSSSPLGRALRLGAAPDAHLCGVAVGLPEVQR